MRLPVGLIKTAGSPGTLKLLTRLGHLVEVEGIIYMARTDSIDPDNVITPLLAASSTYRIAMGPRAGRKVLTLAEPVLGQIQGSGLEFRSQINFTIRLTLV